MKISKIAKELETRGKKDDMDGVVQLHEDLLAEYKITKATLLGMPTEK